MQFITRLISTCLKRHREPVAQVRAFDGSFVQYSKPCPRSFLELAEFFAGDGPESQSDAGVGLRSRPLELAGPGRSMTVLGALAFNIDPESGNLGIQIDRFELEPDRGAYAAACKTGAITRKRFQRPV